MPAPVHQPTGPGRLLVVAPALAVVGAAAWWAWLGWDHQYYEVNGVAQGPYRAWQVVGCAATVVVACVVARVLARHRTGLTLLPFAAAAGVAWPWALDAGADDETGLWVVGFLMLVVGGGLGLLVVVALTDAALALGDRLRHRFGGSAPDGAA